MNEHEIRKVLVLSTAHIEPLTMRRAHHLPNFLADHEYGAYFYVGSVGDVSCIEDPEDYPSDLYACLLYARQLGCEEVKFDSDGPIYEGLKSYDW